MQTEYRDHTIRVGQNTHYLDRLSVWIEDPDGEESEIGGRLFYKGQEYMAVMYCRGLIDGWDAERRETHARCGICGRASCGHPFRSLRDMVYTECPCGCGLAGVCEEQLARVRAANAELPF